MRAIRLRADQHVFDAAHARAAAENPKLEAAFRSWLTEYARTAQDSDSPRAKPGAERITQLLNEMRAQIDTSGRKFTREELNQR